MTVRRIGRDPEATRTLIFKQMLAKAGVPTPHREYRFEPSRRWKADYCWPQQGVILEVEGGVWIRGRHNRGSGFLSDMEKYNHAATLGYRVVRVTPQDLCTEETVAMIQKLLAQRPIAA